jgi:pimeloyl-ACP methyl ester carboxylesterase
MPFTNAGLTFEVREYGTEGKETVVLLHGFPEDAQSWDDVGALLVAQGYRVLAPLQRGYSPRARPPKRRSYRTSATVSDVEALLDAVGVTRAHLVGHDWGGSVAWAFARARPQRLHTVSVVSTPHPGALARAMVTSRQGVMSSYFLLFQLPFLPEALLRAAGGRPAVRRLVHTGLDEATARRYVDNLTREPGAATGALNWYRALPLDLFARLRRTLWARGGGHGGQARRRTPTLYVWGTRDAFIGRKAAELTGEFVPGPYTFAMMEGASHWIPERDPGALTELILTHIRGHTAN